MGLDPHLSPLARTVVCGLLVLAATATAPPQRAEAQGASAAETQPRLAVQTGHSKRIASVAFSPDGRFVLTGSWDATARLWETATGREVRSFDCSLEHETVYQAAFTPDGRYVIAACADRKAHLFDVETGEDVRQFEGGPSYLIEALAVSPDGRHVLLGGSETVQLYEIRTGRLVHTFVGEENVFAAAFSPDGAALLTAGTRYDPAEFTDVSGPIRLWDVASGEQVRTFDVAEGHRNRLRVAFSPDGDHVVSGSIEGQLQLWKTATGDEVWSVGEDADAVTFSPDGRYVITGRQGLVREREPNPDRPVSDIRVGADAFTGERTVVIWEAETGREVRQIDMADYGASSVAVSPDGRYVLAGTEQNNAWMWELETGRLVQAFTGHGGWVEFARLAPDGAHLLIGTEDRTTYLWDVAAGRVAHRQFFPEMKDPESMLFADHDRWDDRLAFSQDGRYVLLRDDTTTRYWDAQTGRVLGADAVRPSLRDTVLAAPRYALTFEGGLYAPAVVERESGRMVTALEGQQGQLTAHAFSPDGRYVLAASWDAYLWEIETGRLVHTLSGGAEGVPPYGIEEVAFSPDGQYALTANGDFTVGYWDLGTGALLHTFEGHSQPVVSLSFSEDQRYVVTGGLDHATRLWDTSTGNEVAALYAFGDAWVVVTPDGRFDTDDLEHIEGVHWVMPDDPLTPLALETFMADFYEPRLLPRLLAGEAFPEVRGLLERNRVQPAVAITDVALAEDGTASVTVEVEGLARAYGGETHASGAHDLRLFRGGQLVAWADGQLVGGTGTASFTFDGLALPSSGSPDAGSLTFSAYAFNGDRVKSRTAYAGLAVPEGAVPARERRAYVVSLGVDVFRDPAWDLRFAANDARQFQAALPPRLEAAGYEVVAVPLVASHDEAASTTATAAALRAVLARLAGAEPDAEAAAALAAVPNAERLQEATPDDLLLITASTHGYADEAGAFYLLPEDVPEGGGRAITPALLEAAVSSDELSAWLRGVDAGTLALVVDACHAAAAVEGTGFKPGPMGSRGLGQLAFDKGMRVLTATQSDDVALESASLAQGLLSFALVRNGLAAGQADADPADGRVELGEWLRYGVGRVPALYEEVRSGAVETFGEGRSEVLGAPAASAPAQQPSLFDFTKGRGEVVLDEAARAGQPPHRQGNAQTERPR